MGVFRVKPEGIDAEELELIDEDDDVQQVFHNLA
jgi:hypothetical protein